MKSISIDLSKTQIEFGPHLRKVEAGPLEDISKMFEKTIKAYCQMNPPVFAINNEKLVLVARHHTYALLMQHFGFTKKLPGIVVAADELDGIKEIEEAEAQFITFLSSKRDSSKMLTPVARSRKRRKEAGLLCPVCGGLLQGPKHHKPDPEKRDHYKVTCFKKHHKKRPCDFRAYLSKGEYQLFRKRNYPTAQWLIKDSKQCRKCGKDLYLRTKENSTILACEDMFRDSGSCDFHVKEVKNGKR